MRFFFCASLFCASALEQSLANVAGGWVGWWGGRGGVVERSEGGEEERVASCRVSPWRRSERPRVCPLNTRMLETAG